MAIYIPSKLRVGYQKREDTFTKKLAYVIYYDNFGKLRKERSWEQWRDDKIEPEEFENVPTSGFVLNKGHTRYSWSHYGDRKTTRVRIYDPRGIEFEITTENLIACLMHTDCSRREITGELVYAWNGTELMLLPCSSEEYVSAKKFTELQAQKFSAKDLKEGATYLTKTEKKVVYLGRFDYYKTIRSKKEVWYNEYKKSKEHIFVADEGWPGYGADEDIGKHHFKPLSPSSALATLVTEDIPDNFAKMVDKYLKKSKHSSPVKRFSVKPPEHEYESRYEYEICDEGKKAIRWKYRDGRYYDYGWDRTRHEENRYKVGWEEDHIYTSTHTEFGKRFSTDRPSLQKGRLIAHFENGAKDERW